MRPGDLEFRRHRVRRRALGNFAARLMAEAARTAGRLRVVPGPDGFLLTFHDVRTLVREGRGFAFARRDLDVILNAPAGWPFAREAALRVYVVGRSGFLHPNSNGVAICIELEGVRPRRVPRLIYDNLIIRTATLDHVVDEDCACFVRSHRDLFPTDARPLYPADAAAREPSAVGEHPAAMAPWTRLGGGPSGLDGPLPVECYAAGGLGFAVPPLRAPTFLRFADSGTPLVEAARRAYLRRVSRVLVASVAGWSDGPGVAVDPATADPAVLRRELVELTPAIAALGDARVAESYLELQSAASRSDDAVHLS